MKLLSRTKRELMLSITFGGNQMCKDFVVIKSKRNKKMKNKNLLFSLTLPQNLVSLNVEPAKSVVHNITKKYGREKGYQYFDKRGEETNLKTLKSFFMYEILINGKEPTSLIEDSYLDKDALRLFELLVNRDKYEKLKAWHEICKANAGLEQENRFKRKIYIFFIEF